MRCLRLPTTPYRLLLHLVIHVGRRVSLEPPTCFWKRFTLPKKNTRLSVPSFGGRREHYSGLGHIFQNVDGSSSIKISQDGAWADEEWTTGRCGYVRRGGRYPWSLTLSQASSTLKYAPTLHSLSLTTLNQAYAPALHFSLPLPPDSFALDSDSLSRQRL